MPDTIFSLVSTAIWLAVCAFALVAGDRPEKYGATAIIIAIFASFSVQRGGNLNETIYALTAIDIILFAVLMGLTFYTERTWPIWAAGCQLIIVMVNIVTVVDLRIREISYFSALTLASYGVMVSLGVGTFWAWQIRRALRPQSKDMDL